MSKHTLKDVRELMAAIKKLLSNKSPHPNLLQYLSSVEEELERTPGGIDELHKLLTYVVYLIESGHLENDFPNLANKIVDRGGSSSSGSDPAMLS